MITIELNNSELSKAFRSIDKYNQNVKDEISKQIKKSAYAIHDSIIQIWKQNLKTTSRNLESGLRPNFDKYSATLRTDYKSGDYYIADLLEEGTNPHVILPVRAKVLAWNKPAVAMSVKTHVRSYMDRKGGLTQQKQKAFAMKVNHPGTKAIKAINRSVEKEKPNYISSIINILKNK